jgi:hypothetical protein
MCSYVRCLSAQPIHRRPRLLRLPDAARNGPGKALLCLFELMLSSVFEVSAVLSCFNHFLKLNSFKLMT